jgi:hypothetical protein
MRGCSCRTAITLNQRLLPLLLTVLVLPVLMVVMLLLLMLEVVDTPVVVVATPAVVVVAGGCAPVALPALQQLPCKQQLQQQRPPELVPSPLEQQPAGPQPKQAAQLLDPVGVVVLLPRAYRSSNSSSGRHWVSCSGSSSGSSSGSTSNGSS